MHIVENGLFHNEKERAAKYLERATKKTDPLKTLEVLHNKLPTIRFSSEITDTSNTLSEKLKAELQAEEKQKYGDEWVGKMKTIRILSEGEDSSDDDSSMKVQWHTSYFENDDTYDDDCDSIDDDDDDDDDEDDVEDPWNKIQTMMMEKENVAQVNHEKVRVPTMQLYYDGIWNEPLVWFQPHASSQK
ncbi:pheromone-processing carboxypeptidase KEX1-like [Cimex lectularius]|uniref:Uncharacterized protein n=1 Tax=Cimex lectularius TaxID=79782 RepID=A0A8I6RSK0_CIMLE|nr:pheromone-processing carboxypeptidase KEX1-like [Cimex lectularius]